MSVLKRKRNISKMEFYHNAIQLRLLITEFLLRDFGIKSRRRDLNFAYGGDAQRKNTFLLTSNLGGAWFVMTRDESGGNDYFVATIYVTNMKSTSWTFATKAKKSINGSNVINTVTYKPIRLYKVVVRKISD